MTNISRHFSILLPAILALTGNVFAADEKPQRTGRGGFAPRQPEARLKVMTEKLALNEEQQGKVKAILEKNLAKVVELAEDKSLANEDRRAKITDVRKAEMQEISGLLTPEQREKLKELLPPENDGTPEKKAGTARDSGKPAAKADGK
jgi:Spy/CpxP family protein refolding chaperone